MLIPFHCLTFPTIKITRQNTWHQLLKQFDLPETTSVPQPNGQQAIQPVARVLQQYYQVILGNFEELYRKNVAEQARKAKAIASQMRPGDSQGSASRVMPGSQQAGSGGVSQSSQQGAGGGVENVMSMMGQQLGINTQSFGASTNGAPSFPLQQTPQSPHSTSTPTMAGVTPIIDSTVGQSPISAYPAHTGTHNILDHEQDGLGKRKLESEEAELKRARQKTGEIRFVPSCV